MSSPKLARESVEAENRATPAVSVIIPTYNELPNVGRAVRSARLLTDDVVVIDSGSSDGTQEEAKRLGARVLVRPFDDMAAQRNAALLDGKLTGTWALMMDADEMITERFASALRSLLATRPDVDAVRICRKFHFWGDWARAASNYPRFIDRVVRVGKVTFVKEGHGEVFRGADVVARLDEPLHDEDLKPLRGLVARQSTYALMEAERDIAILEGRASDAPSFSRWRARLRRIPGWPLLYLGALLTVRGGLFEGRGGRRYAAVKTMYEFLVRLYVDDSRRRRP